MIPLGSPLAPKFNTYNYKKKCDVPPMCYDFSKVSNYLNSKDVKEALGVADRKWTECNMVVHSFLMGDWFTNAAPKVENLLKNGIKVLVYSGKLDYICNYIGGEMWFKAL